MLTHERTGELFTVSTDWPPNAKDATDWVFETHGIVAELRRRIFQDNAATVHRFPDTLL